MTPPCLETERLLLLPLSAAAEGLYEAFYTDAEASRFYNGPLSTEAARARLAADMAAWQRQGFGVWLLQRKAQGDGVGEGVGACGFWQGVGWPRELTWWLLPHARGVGLALEASRAALTQAYKVWGWPAVETYTNDDNAAARALVRRLGGVSQGRRMFPDGHERELFRLPPPAPEVAA
jgi:[ribosomal protein S5]-alanine N-acetyltransferase